MTWYEKYYGVPPPVKSKLAKLLQEEQNKEQEVQQQIKESAWYRAKHDYIEHIRNENEKT